MAFLYGLTLAFLLLMSVSILMSEARVLARYDDDDGGDYPAAMNADSSDTGGGHVHFRSVSQPKDDIPPEIQAQMPPPLRNMPSAQFKQMMMGAQKCFKKCTVSELNLAELTGTWMLVSFGQTIRKEKVIVVFNNDRPGHLEGILKAAGEPELKLNITQPTKELPGLLLHIVTMPDGKVGTSALLIVAHKRHRYIVTLVLRNGQPEYGMYARVHHKSSGKKPKPATRAELMEAKAAVQCLFKELASLASGGKNVDLPEPAFHNVL